MGNVTLNGQNNSVMLKMQKKQQRTQVQPRMKESVVEVGLGLGKPNQILTWDRFVYKPKGVVGLIMVKESVIRISIPLDLSCRSFVPLSRFIRSRRPTPLLVPLLVLCPPCSA